MASRQIHGSCHCGAVRYEATIDLSRGTVRCNCSICKKARAWFTFVSGDNFHLLKGEDSMSTYRWTPKGRKEPGLTYRFCKTCGVRLYATGFLESLGGRFYALAVSTFDDVTADELTLSPLKFVDNLHDRPDKTPADIRML